MSRIFLLLPLLTSCVTVNVPVQKQTYHERDLVTITHPFFRGLCCQLTGINDVNSSVRYNISCENGDVGFVTEKDFEYGCRK